MARAGVTDGSAKPRYPLISGAVTGAENIRLFILGLLPLFSACASVSNPVAPPQVIREDAQVILLGEVHDNPRHHLNQARYIREIRPAAVAFEMLSPSQATIVNNRPDRGTDLREALNWQNSGWPDWEMYQPVFEALDDARIYGMALPKESVRQAVSDGAATVFDGDAKAFGLNDPLPQSEQSLREQHQQSVHCNMLPPSLLPGMVEAQRLRDASFALTALHALKQTRGPVVVITGTGHVRKDWGMPAAIAKASPQAVVISVGQFEEGADESRGRRADTL